MSEYTSVQFGAMEQGQADFQGTLNSLRGTIGDLETQLQRNLSDWEGSAVQAYHEAQAKWNLAMDNMQAALNSIQSVIGTANDNYMQAEAANTARWGG
jgi:6 kDa early secretory antigenic target